MRDSVDASSDPFISGIAWVSELIERAGGDDIFAELRTERAAQQRVVSSEQICRANPEIIFASWCGKPVEPGAIASRRGWSELAAVRSKQIHEIAGEDILQPGFGLANGYDRLKTVIRDSRLLVNERHPHPLLSIGKSRAVSVKQR